MNENDLNHPLTPSSLEQVNAQILSVLTGESEKWFESFFQLIEKRDSVIREHLKHLDEPTRKAFAEAELVVNKHLADVAKKLLDSAKDDMSQFVRSQAAIKKYK